MFEEDYRIYGDLWLYDCQKDTVKQLTKNTYHAKSKDNYPFWSPNSNKIYFSAGGSIFEYDIGDENVKVLLKTDIEKDNRTVFAPSLSRDGKKLAYWVKNNKDNTHGINYLDLATGDEVSLTYKLFNPGTHVTFYNPQWARGDSVIIATFFHPGNNIELTMINVHNMQEQVLAKSLYSTFFVAREGTVYFTKPNLESKERELFTYNLADDSTRLIMSGQNAVFDVDHTGVLYYSRNDSTFRLLPDGESQFVTLGSNPTIKGDKLVVERWPDANTLQTKLILLEEPDRIRNR
jgi:tricorn protease-like protein